MPSVQFFLCTTQSIRCAHCRQLEPIWRAFSEEAAGVGITVAKVEPNKQMGYDLKTHARHTYAHAHLLIHIHTHVQTYKHTRSSADAVSASNTCSHPHTQIISLSRARALTNTHSHTLIIALCCTLLHAHKIARSHVCSNARTHVRTHARTHARIHMPAFSPAHACTHVHSPALQNQVLDVTLVFWFVPLVRSGSLIPWAWAC